MYKYFTKNHTCRYLDVINKLLASYNNSVHSKIGMPPNKVTPSNIYSVWQKMNSLRGKIPHGRVKFKMEDLVRITKENVKFAMGMKKIFSTEIFQVVKSIQRMPQPVYEFSDLQARPIVGTFYNYERVKDTVSHKPCFK